MTQAIEGYGTILASSPDGVTYTNRSEIIKISLPGMEGKEIDASHLLSPNGFMEWIPGMVNAGELTFETNWLKTEMSAVYAMFRTTLFWRITFTTGSTFVCLGFLSKLGAEIPHDDKITMPITIKLTGKPTFSA